MQLLYREHQVPILAPNDIAVLNGKATELARIKVFVVLRMRMAANEIPHIHNLHRIVAEGQCYGQVSCTLSFDDMVIIHHLHCKNTLFL